jgi:monofunctional biosynthetic peptidoglycan transglycosylase
MLRTIGRAIAVIFAVAFGILAAIFLTLPDVRPLRTSNPQTTAFMELRAREARARGDEPTRIQQWVPYPRIAPSLKRAVLVAEDSAFWRHDGLDYDQIKESMEVNLARREFARGASTITQQLAKNLYLSPSKNPLRKLRELLIARRLEAELSKQRILEIYLNVIEWGNGIYGAEAAARSYFRKPASRLTAQEAALLAAAIRSPRVFTPGHPSARLRGLQQMILRRMGAVTPPPVIASEPAIAVPLPVPAGTLMPEATAPPAVPDMPEPAPPTELPGSSVPPPPPPCPTPPCAPR